MFTNKLHKDFLKSIGIIAFCLAIIMSSCGVKIAIKQSFNIQNFAGQSLKTTTQCSFYQNKQHNISTSNKDNDADDSQLNTVSSKGLFKNIDNNIAVISHSPSARSIPLYILYQQQRDAILS